MCVISYSPARVTQFVITGDILASTSPKPSLDPDTQVEDGEEMEVSTAEDESMMAMMGLTGFGSTKVWISYLVFSHPLTVCT